MTGSLRDLRRAFGHTSPCHDFSFARGVCSWKFQATISRPKPARGGGRSLLLLVGLVLLLLSCMGQFCFFFLPGPGPAAYFGSAEYFDGRRLQDPRYEHLDALRIKDKKTGIILWSLAIDARENPDQKGLREGDRVLFHYTDKESFLKITRLDGAKIFASMDSKDSTFGYGCYACKKAPHIWASKAHIGVNNFLPSSTIAELEGKSLEDLVQGDVGKYVNTNYCGKTDYCIPVIVDRQVAKNVMEEHTDAPAMQNGGLASF